MKEQLQAIANEALAKLEHVEDMKSLEEIRILFLGKKGKLTSILKGMGSLSAEERPVVGQMVNDVRKQLRKRYRIQEVNLLERTGENIAQENIDVTMPELCYIKKHPLTQVLDEIKEVFIGMVMKLFYTSSAHQSPEGIPRLFFKPNENVVLRSQTSPVQIRVMEKKNHH